MKIATRKGLKRGFSALQMFYWCTHGSFLTFFVSFITDTKNVSEGYVGILLALYMLGAMGGQFAFNALCDRYQFNRKLFLLVMPTVLALYVALYFSPNIAAITPLYIVLGFIHPAMPAVLDTWIIRSLADEPEAYGPIRSTASITFAVLIFVEGLLIDWLGYTVMLPLAVLFVSGCAVTAFIMPEIPKIERRESGAKSKGFSAVPATVWIFVGALLLSGVANAPALQMLQLVIKGLGGSVTYFSIAIFANAAAEFPVMQLSRKLMRFSPAARLVVSLSLYVLAATGMFLANSPVLIIVMCALNGAAYGLLLPARRQMIAEQAPAEMQNRMHGIGDAAYGSLGGVIGNMMGGAAMGSAGAKLMLGISAALQAASLAGMALMAGADRKNSSVALPKKKSLRHTEDIS